MLDGPAGGRGKWAREGVPHRGWSCINAEDLGVPSMRCEMCEHSEIRYVQYMRHPAYRGVLGCGAVCAGHMEQDPARAQRREKAMVSSARRRAQFPRLKGWRLNRSGNWQIELRKFRVTIFRKPTGWGAVVGHPMKPDSTFTRQRFPSFAEAQLAAFDTLTFVERDIGGRPTAR